MSVRCVWITQCLCPQRHCVLAVANEAESREEAERAALGVLRDAVGTLVAASALNPHCGLCGAERETWRYELAQTAWATLAEAAPALCEEQRKQVALRSAFGDLHLGTRH